MRSQAFFVFLFSSVLATNCVCACDGVSVDCVYGRPSLPTVRPSEHLNNKFRDFLGDRKAAGSAQLPSTHKHTNAEILWKSKYNYRNKLPKQTAVSKLLIHRTLLRSAYVYAAAVRCIESSSFADCRDRSEIMRAR